MSKHKLIRLQIIIEERIGSLIEEVEIATNMKLNSLYIANLKDELESLQWTTRIIRWVLDTVDGHRQLGVNRTKLESEDIKKFENMLDDKMQELELELEDSNSDREKEIVVNQIDTLNVS
jgi:ACT domain-containing protein